METYLTSDSELACPDYCVYDAGYNCKLCNRFTNTRYWRNKMNEDDCKKIGIRPKFLFIIKCFNGGWGWGEKGQVGYIVSENDSLDNAIKYIKKVIPGGWGYKYLGLTELPIGLNTNLSFDFRSDFDE